MQTSDIPSTCDEEVLEASLKKRVLDGKSTLVLQGEIHSKHSQGISKGASKKLKEMARCVGDGKENRFLFLHDTCRVLGKLQMTKDSKKSM